MKFKKILSLLLSVIMVMSTLTPAIVTAVGCDISVESVEVMEGASSASADVSISQNPGITYVRLAVTYKAAELAPGDADITSAMYDTVSTSNIRATQIANFIPADEVSSDYKGFYVDIEDSNWVNIYDDGVLATLNFDLASSEAGAAYTYYVTVVEACDENEDEVVVNGELVCGTVSCVADENLGKYEDFTLFFAPENVWGEIGETVDLDLRVDANPGVWSIRCMIVYPEALSIETDAAGEALIENGTIFEDKALNLGISNLPLTDDRVLSGYKSYFASEGIPTEGYNSIVLYYEPDTADAVITGNGVLASIPFNTDNAVSGESYEVKVYYIYGDIFRAESGTSFVDLFPATVSATISFDGGYVGCAHEETYSEIIESTCTQDGVRSVYCAECGELLLEETIVAPGHFFNFKTVDPTCTEGGYTWSLCEYCGLEMIRDETEPTGHSYVGGKCEICGEESGEAASIGITADSIEVLEGTTTVYPSVHINNNVGSAYIKLAVVFKSAELLVADDYVTSDLFDIVSTSNIRTTQIAKYIPEGETASEYKGFFVEVENESFNNVYEDGRLATLALDLVAPAVGDTYEYYVTVVDACDSDEAEVSFGEGFCRGSVSYIKDENLDKYDDFTMFFTPESTLVEKGDEVRLDLRLDKNPGLWSIRCMIVYPDELYLEESEDGIADVQNGVIFGDSEINVGIANIPLTDDRIIPKYQEYFASNGIPTEGYSSTVLYFEPEAYDAVVTGSGVLASFSFKTDRAYEGDSYDIKVYYVSGDIFRAEGNMTFVDLFPATVDATINMDGEYAGCRHEHTKAESVAATCTEDGYNSVICTSCKELISYEIITAPGHNYLQPGSTVIVPPTCMEEGYTKKTCQVCGDVSVMDVIEPGDDYHDLLYVPAVAPTCTYNGNIEYWYCAYCHAYWINEELTIITNSKNVLIPATGHSGDEVYTVPPTCTEDGYRDYYCSNCGIFLREEALPAPGHNYLQPGSTVIVPPTCTEGGYTQRTCQVCGEVEITDVTDPCGHSYVEGVCEDCGEHKYDDICTISTESVVVFEGGTTADAAVSINNNHGMAYLQLAVVSKIDEIYLGDAYSDVFDNIDIITMQTSQIAQYIPEGENASEYLGFFVRIETGDWKNVYTEGEIVTLSFGLVAPEVGDVFNYYVTADNAIDEYGDGVLVEDDVLEGTVSYLRDEYLGKYSELTMFMAPESLVVNTEDASFDMDLRMDANPGLWSVRCYVVYPEELTLNSVKNGNIFKNDSELNVGIYDLALDSENQVSAFKDLIASEGIVTEGYRSTTLYFEPEDYNAVVSGSGILANLNFSLSASARPGEVYDVKVYYANGDIFSAETVDGQTTFTDYYPSTVGATVAVEGEFVCYHYYTHAESADPTCTEDGYYMDVCNDCGEIFNYRTIGATGHYYEGDYCSVCGHYIYEDSFAMYFTPDYIEVPNGSGEFIVNLDLEYNPGIWGARFYVVYPEELVLQEANNGYLYGDSDMNVGVMNLPLDSDSQVSVFKELIAEQGIETEGYHSTTFYFEPESISDVITGNGTLASFRFALAEGAEGWQEYDIRVYYAEGDIFSADVDSMTFTDRYPSTNVCNVYVYEEYVCTHSYTTTETVPATCTESGYTRIYCKDCGTELSYYELPPIGHKFVGGVCTVCGEKDASELDGIYAGRVNVLEGTAEASVPISIYNNPGFAYAEFAVVFKSAELAMGDDCTSALFDTVSMGTIRSNHLGNYIPEGADKAEYKGFIVSVENESFENVTEDGVIVTIPFELVDPEIGDVYTYYVTSVGAYNENDDEVIIEGELVEGTISVVKDEYLGKYDDFTMFFAPEEIEVEAGEKANVDLRVDANPGLWSIRCMIVYPEALSLDADESGLAVVENGSIFADSELHRGIANLPLTDDRLLEKYAEYFDAEGIEKEGYNSVVLYFEPEAFDAMISGNGVLASFSFNTDNCVEGESYDINIYYVVGDIFRAEGQTFTDLFPATVGTTVNIPSVGGACEHANVTVNEVPATCTEAGSKTTVCNDCGKTIEAAKIPAQGHVPSDAICGQSQICTVCGEILADAIPHTPGKAVVIPATCTEEGSRTVSCIVCGELISTEVIMAPGHNYLQPGSTVIVPPTCTEGGYTQKTCQVCGDVAIMDETEPDGHSFVDGKCEVCGEWDESYVKHNIIHFDAVEPGCHYTGNIEYWYCSECNGFWADEALTQVTNSKSVILPELGSESLVHFEAVEATCIKNGNIEYWFCPECECFWADEALTQLTNRMNVILPKKDHVSEILPAIAPTCSQLGLTQGVKCSVCGEILVAQTPVAKIPHTMGSPVTVPSTCVVNGTVTTSCIYCSYKTTETLPLKSHVYEDGFCINCKKADTDPSIVVSDATSSKGKTFSVTVDLKNNPGIVSMYLNVHYDESALKLIGVEDAGVLGTNAHKPELVCPYTLTWVNDTATKNYTVNGTIVTLTFEVLEDAEFGEYEIYVTYDNRNYDIFDKDLNTVDFETVSGTVNVVDYIVGDVNGDGVVNKLDRVVLTRYLANWDDYQEIDLLAADVNEDGEVNNLDRVILTRYLADWEEYPELPHIN